ncbi:hypothetical protein ACNOHN_13800 [Bacteroides zhangwenhongii]|uniref:hypothetical protein n=1 Tax=Bacteroides zhangwenhongii TaxID=2650157 RepID=UPI003AAF028A
MEINTYIVVVSWEQNTTIVKQVIEKIGDYILLFDNTILVNTESRSSEIRDALKQVLTDNAQIYVCKLDRGSAWSNVNVPNISIKAFYRNE